MNLSASTLSLFGGSSSSGTSVVSMDLSLLLTSTSSVNAFSRTPASYTTRSVSAPWTNAPETPVGRRGEAALAARRFVDPAQADVLKAGNDPDLKTTFALYKALDQLKALADYAAQKTTSSALRTRLDAQFQKGMAEVQAFVAASDGNKLSYIYGKKESRLESVTVGKTSRAVEGKGVAIAAPTAAIPGLTGTESFTLTLKKAGYSDTFTLNLADIDGPVTVGAVVGLMNEAILSKSATNGLGDPLLDGEGQPIPLYSTRAELYKDTKGNFGLRFKTSSTETVALGDPATPPALSVTTQVSSTSLTAPGPSVGALYQINTPAGAASVTKAADIHGVDSEATQLAQTLFDNEQAGKKLLEGALKPVAPGAVKTATQVNAVATDSQGFTYVLGTATGDMNGQQGSDTQDLFLTKYGSDGKAVFSRLMGVGDATQGYALAIDANDNVVVAGQTRGDLTGRDVYAGQDAFITKFSSKGEELVTAQLDGLGATSIRALALDASGNAVVAGVGSGTVRAGFAPLGGQDVFVAKVDLQPRVVEGATSRVTDFAVYGTSATDSVGGVVVTSDGAVTLATTENGRGIVRRLNADDLTQVTQSHDLGDLGGGQVGGLVRNTGGTTVAVVGTTTADVTAGGGTVVGSRSGERDAFALTFAATTLSAQDVYYLGSSGRESVGGAAFLDETTLALTGATSGTLAGPGRKGTEDGFVARLDLAGQTIADVQQFGTLGTRTVATGVAYGATGRSATLEKLGFSAGVLTPEQSSDLLAGTSLRPGDFFYLSQEGGRRTKITIAAGDTFARLARRINNAFPGKIEAVASELTTGSKLQLKAKGTAELVLEAGTPGQDALEKLGLSANKLLAADKLFGIGDDAFKAATTAGGTFALNLDRSFAVGDEKAAAYVSTQLANALGTLQRGYKSLYYDPLKAELAQQSTLGRGGGSAYLTQQLNNYQDALARLGG